MAQVALIIFNRPDLVQVQAELLKKQPLERLFVIADGPREGTDDAARCEAARAVIHDTDWPCPVETNFAELNLGSARRIVSGLDWVFSRTDRAVILEDDCLADPTLFPFCDELLDRYAGDPTVMHICGANLQPEITFPYSYRFSHHIVCFGGWATWARAWANNDLGMHVSDARMEALLRRHMFGDSRAIEHWRSEIDLTRRGKLDAWDYPWQVSVWDKEGSAIHPARNLISNVGFRADGTHTRNSNSPLANLPTRAMKFPLDHPPSRDFGHDIDRAFVKKFFSKRRKKQTFAWRALRKARRVLLGR